MTHYHYSNQCWQRKPVILNTVIMSFDTSEHLYLVVFWHLIDSHFCLECGTLLKNIITLFKIMPFYMLINSRPILSCKITAQ